MRTRRGCGRLRLCTTPSGVGFLAALGHRRRGPSCLDMKAIVPLDADAWSGASFVRSRSSPCTSDPGTFRPAEAANSARRPAAAMASSLHFALGKR
jgi:hypothetical protein